MGTTDESRNAKSMRWHPLVIKWCLNLKLFSARANSALRTSGFLKLSSERTLKDYSSVFASKVGFQEVDHQLVEEVNAKSLPPSRKFVSLALNEMRIKESIVYDSGGFTNIGDINRRNSKNGQARVGAYGTWSVFQRIVSLCSFPN